MVNRSDNPHRFFPLAEWSAERGYVLPRLICLPWAGGSASAFRPWMGVLGKLAQVLAVELPGHGARYGELCLDDAYELAVRIADAVLALPRADTPLVIYGHSMGALLGFEAARILSARSAPLLGLVLTGYHAPHWQGKQVLRSRMSDAVLLEDLRQLGGTAPEILDSPDLLSIVLPILRSDYRLTEVYCPTLADLMPRLSLPVDIIGGEGDADNPRESLWAWKEALSGPVDVSVWPGGHFFVDDQQPALLKHLARRLEEWSRAGGLWRRSALAE
jgi:surfactin synthase thioesterase subunit